MTWPRRQCRGLIFYSLVPRLPSSQANALSRWLVIGAGSLVQGGTIGRNRDMNAD
jgi:hypothetical protein